jgi:hypothetical protein
MASRSSREAKRQKKLNDETAVRLAKINLWKWIIGLPMIPLTMWALTPVAGQFAGEDTKLNVQIAMTLTVGLTVACSITGAAFLKERRRANRLATRNEHLQIDVAREKGAAEITEKQMKTMEKELNRLRSVTGAASSAVAQPGKDDETG